MKGNNTRAISQLIAPQLSELNCFLCSLIQSDAEFFESSPENTRLRIVPDFGQSLRMEYDKFPLPQTLYHEERCVASRFVGKVHSEGERAHLSNGLQMKHFKTCVMFAGNSALESHEVLLHFNAKLKPKPFNFDSLKRFVTETYDL